MTVYSQNGYAANDPSLIGKYTVPGSTVKVNLRKGDVSVVLLHFMAWFDDHIEKLRQDVTGGYNPRKIAGTNIWSNHASGTAVDLNWDQHPMGAHGTFSSAEVAKIHTQLKFYEGALRWGGDYTGSKDEMHFEINRAKDFVATIAKKCKAPTVLHPTGSRTLLDDGSPYQKGHDAKWVQEKVGLAASAQDGIYGPATARAVKSWQTHHMGVKAADGAVGPKTWAAMGVKVTY